MKKLLPIFAMFALVPNFVFGADGTKLNIRRIGLDISQTSVKNSAEYIGSSISALTADSSEYFRGIGDIALEYDHGELEWNNTLFMEYGRTQLKPIYAPHTTSKDADKIQLSSNLAYGIWKYDDLKFGPTARGQYETEFVASDGAPHRNVLRAMAGMALFDHPIIKDLYLVGVYEYDFTFDPKNGKTAAELGWKLEYKIRDGVNLSTDGYYREYLTYTDYFGVDLERDLSANLRLDTNLWGNFTMGPFVGYRLAKSRAADVYGSNLKIGISFNYITSFQL
ncbi:MAG: DUF3078 domain-containing protein [Rickettsiales bacterium]|jgi:hypothetical protein|nr:DUF3078 domain-containing protein [Rickettsiales bacterium]